MRLSQFLRSAAGFTVSTSQVQQIAHKYLNQFFHEFNLPVPEVKLVKKMGVGWLARDVWRPSTPDTTTLEINVYLIESEEQLDRIIAHELIHHYNFVVLKYGKLSGGMAKMMGHGPEFKKWAAKINSVKGADYVTEKSDQISTTEVPEFYVLVKEIRPGTIGWAWSKRPSAKQLEAIKVLQEKGWKLTKSKMYELSYGPTIGPRAPYATTRNDKINDVLQELWQKAA
jgi:hypothetical protein